MARSWAFLGYLVVVSAYVAISAMELATDERSRERVNSELIEAVMEKNEILAQRALNRSACPNWLDSQGWCAMHYAAVTGSRITLKLLLDHAGDINARDVANQATPLHYASQYHSPEFIAWMVSQGADKYAQDESGGLPLHAAASKGNKGVVEWFTSQGVSLSSQLHSGAMPIHCAALNGHRELVEWIIKSFSPPESEGLKAYLMHLLASPENYLSAPDHKGHLPIHYAASMGQKQVVAFLLKRGSNINARGRSGNTLLHCAADGGHEELVQWLLERGLNLNASNNRSQTPLQRAHLNRHQALVQWLIDLGAQISPSDNPLHERAKKLFTDKLVQQLIFKAPHARVNYPSVHVRDLSPPQRSLLNCALKFAAAHGQAEDVRFILIVYNDILQESSIHRALIRAALNGHLAIIIDLMEKSSHKLNPVSLIECLATALKLAAAQRHIQIVTYLLAWVPRLYRQAAIQRVIFILNSNGFTWLERRAYKRIYDLLLADTIPHEIINLYPLEDPTPASYLQLLPRDTRRLLLLFASHGQVQERNFLKLIFNR
jgi:ankyrin repeat protein